MNSPGRLPATVLMTADAVGGVWTYALDVAGGLGRQGVQVHLAVLGPAAVEEQRSTTRAAPGVTLHETGLPLDWTAVTPDEVRAAGRAVARLADAIKADLVHLNSPALAAAGGFGRPILAVCHSCVATWWAAVRGGPLPRDLAWRAELTGRGYRAADALLAPSRAFADATRSAYDLPARPRVVANGIRPRALAQGEESSHVLTAGRLWDAGKNVVTLDRAAARLTVPVLAAGPLRGPDGSTVDLRHAVPLGTLSAADLAARMAERPVFAALPVYEPFGLAVLEAASAGCALVLSDIPTFRELWDSAALFVAPLDEAAAAAAIEGLFRDPRERARLASAARTRAARLSLDATVSGTLNTYRELARVPAAAA